jgi:hypothetical protein
MPGLVPAHASICVYLRVLCKTRDIVQEEKVRLLRGGERRRKGEAAPGKETTVQSIAKAGR